ncbi:MAG: metallophosphoesterase [Candidatus Pacearchaeota archaeon]
MEIKEEIFRICSQNSILIDKEILKNLEKLETNLSKKIILSFVKLGKKGILTKDFFLNSFYDIINFFDNNEKTLVKNFFVSLGFKEKTEERKIISYSEKVKIILSYNSPQKKISVSDFIDLFNYRYNFLKELLIQKNLGNYKPIKKITRERSNIIIIVSILNKRVTKNNNIIFDVEDLSGIGKVIVNFSKNSTFEKAKKILPDDVVAFSVFSNGEVFFANDVFFPDCFLQDRKKSKEEEFTAFISDIHVGSTMFLERNFRSFIEWLNSEDQIAKKVRYLFIIGDCVDGTAVYPEQEKYLLIKDMYKQYEYLGNLLDEIKKDIKIIICPGQHDAVWVGEPQPPIPKEWAKKIYELPNVYLVSNPSLVEISEGFKVLMYHGAGMHGIIESLEEIRASFGHRSPSVVIKEMLRRRLLCPAHGNYDYVPNGKKDFHLIEEIPDIICTGDLHRPEVSYYNNILIVSSSCWQSKTPFEEKVGHEPDPCKVPILNLKTREIKILNFSNEEKF